MEAQYRTTHSKSKQTKHANRVRGGIYRSHSANNLLSHPSSNKARPKPTSNAYVCDRLLCIIFCLGFIIALLIAIVIYALIQHQHSVSSNNSSSRSSKSSNANEEPFGRTVIDRSREVDISNIDAEYLPDPLPPLKSKKLEQNTLYQTLRDDIERMKIPNDCSLVDQLYECEGAYFENFTHYNDDWSGLVETEWTLPSKIYDTNPEGDGKFLRWRYDVINYPIIPLFLSSAKPRDHIKLTIVTQTSMDRLNLIEMICQNWNGVISVAIYVRLEHSVLHAQQLVIELFERVEKKYEALLDISLLFETDYLYKRTVTTADIDNDKKFGGLFAVMYPVNHLRNLALQCAKTELVLLTDGDFMPSTDFHDKAIKQYQLAMDKISSHFPRPNRTENTNDNNATSLNSNSKATEKGNVVLVIPAFEFGSSYKKYSAKQRKRMRGKVHRQEKRLQGEYVANMTRHGVASLPLTKAKVVELYEKDEVRGFHIHRCAACHEPTNFTKWMKVDEPYVVRYKASYEPYILTRRLGLSRYDARFRGYGWNKIVHLLTLAWVHRTHWVVASDLFIFHLPHSESRDASLYFKGKKSMFFRWITGLSKLALRDLKQKKDQTGRITA